MANKLALFVSLAVSLHFFAEMSASIHFTLFGKFSNSVTCEFVCLFVSSFARGYALSKSYYGIMRRNKAGKKNNRFMSAKHFEHRTIMRRTTVHYMNKLQKQ
uniref:(northern house mosquito) hypothetical protein n=1 Tax=Culex pipiens TaxID=7175 RepID=A0A8D8AVR6_CULPI